MSLSRRQWFKGLLAALSAPSLGSLSGCESSNVKRSLTYGRRLYQAPEQTLAQHLPQTGIPAVDQAFRRAFKKQLHQLLAQLKRQWGDQTIASPKKYVKYSDRLKTRAIIDFPKGRLRIETVEPKRPLQHLEKAIVETLLTPENPSQIDLLSDRPIRGKGKPFLQGLVLDHHQKPITQKRQAQSFARYLIRHRLKKDRYHRKRRYYVVLKMAKNHQRRQIQHYTPYVEKYSRRYHLPTSLVYAIIETESSFNPYAMSPIPAYGLMQIVPTSAGRDAYRLIYGKQGTPSKNQLFHGPTNIHMGCAYLHILNQRYLRQIRNATARHYCTIAAYNTGAGNVFKAFHPKKSIAIQKINQLNSQQVYNHLRHHLKYAEARNYLKKVVIKQKKYQS